MRLIDADALKEAIEEKVTYIDGDSVYKIIDLIDNAPTVEDTPNILQSNFSIKQYKADLQASHDCGYAQGYIGGSTGADMKGGAE